MNRWKISFIMLNFKCGQPCVNFPSCFQQWGLDDITFSNSFIDSKLGLFNVGLKLPSFSQFVKRLKIGIFDCCTSHTYQFFPVNERDWKLRYLNICLNCTSKFLSVHLRDWNFRFFKFPCFHILSDYQDSLSGMGYAVERESKYSYSYSNFVAV